MTLTSMLEITDGAETIRFFGAKSPYKLISWTPAIAGIKNGGVWDNPLFDDERYPVSTPRDNTVETFDIQVTGYDFDNLASNMRRLTGLLEKAQSYWTTSWLRTPVYLAVRGDCETNARYAIIKGYTITNLDDIFNPYADKVQQISLVIERGHWQKLPIGQSRQAAISQIHEWDYPYFLYFDGQTQRVVINSYSAINNLADNAFTAEAWIYPLGHGGYAQYGIAEGRIFDKTNGTTAGWYLSIINGVLEGRIYCSSGTSSYAKCPITYNQWHHVAMTWDDATDRKVYLFIDGVKQSTTSGTSAGAIVADSAFPLVIGNRYLAHSAPKSPAGFHGYIGWTRILNHVRYTENFTPISRTMLPPVDSNTVGAWIREGNGSTTYNLVSTGNNGSILPSTYWAGSNSRGITSNKRIYSMHMDGSQSYANIYKIGASSLDNLPNGDYTVEAWIRSRWDYSKEYATLFAKSDPSTGLGWSIWIDGSAYLSVQINHTTTSVIATSSQGIVTNKWLHIAMCYTYSTKTAKLFINGIHLTNTSTAGVGSYVGDSGNRIYVGFRGNTYTNYFRGDIGWLRISNNVRYSLEVNTIPELWPPPASDANSLALFYLVNGDVSPQIQSNKGTLTLCYLYLFYIRRMRELSYE